MKEIFNEIFMMAWPTITIVLSIAIILRLFYLKQSKKKFIFHEEFFMLLFLLYILVLYELLTYQDVQYGTNFIPFKEILRYNFGSTGFYRQVIGNIAIFIPFGYFVSKYIKLNKIGYIFLISLCTSSIIEGVQYFIGRCFDIDDIILNIIGSVIGFLLFIALDAIKKKLPKLFQKDFIYNLFVLLIIVAIIIYFLGIYNF